MWWQEGLPPTRGETSTTTLMEGRKRDCAFYKETFNINKSMWL